jgi:acetyl esterase/lipase
MTVTDDQRALRVPERVVPVPSTVSPEAQAILAMGPMPTADYPALDDIEGWRAYVRATDETVLGIVSQAGPESSGAFEVEEIDAEGVRIFHVMPSDVDPADRRVYLDVHGGAFVVGGGEVCRNSGTMTSRRMGMRVWAVDYRMPPDHPHPAAVDDCMSAYRALLRVREPHEIVVGGGSAGGNIAAALVLRARDEGLPMPAVAILLTPAVDLTRAGDTHRTNFGVDTVLTNNEGGPLMLYIGAGDPKDPYLSPVYGDFSPGFPPTLLASGTRDVLLSDTVRMHRALRRVGVRAELHVLEAAPHGFFMGAAPEDQELDREVRRFIDEHAPV